MTINNYGLPSPLTAQAIFDKVALHLIRQGRAAHDGQRCVYRETPDIACAVGCLISDDRYVFDMEGKTVFHMISEFMPELTLFEGMLYQLQIIHDSGDEEGFGDTLKERLAGVAEKFGLSTAVLNPTQPWSAPQAVEITEPTLPDAITRWLGSVTVEATDA